MTPDPKPSTAIAVASNPAPAPTKSTLPAPMSMEPRDMRQLWWLCQHLVGTGFLPRAIQSPGQAVAVVLAGKDLGLSAMQSLRGLNIVEGKVGLNADLMLGLMLKGGVRHEWVESTAKVATLRVERPGSKPMTYSYTMEMAQRAGLVKPSGAWVKHPEAMLRARAISAVCRAYAPDLGMGLYLPDEIDGRVPPTEPPDGGYLEAQPVVTAAPAVEVVDQATGEVKEAAKSPADCKAESVVAVSVPVKAGDAAGIAQLAAEAAAIVRPDLAPASKAKRKSKGDALLDAAGVSAPAAEATEAQRLQHDPLTVPNAAPTPGLPPTTTMGVSLLDQALSWIREAPHVEALSTLRKPLHELHLSEEDSKIAGEAYRTREADLRRGAA